MRERDKKNTQNIKKKKKKKKKIPSFTNQLHPAAIAIMRWCLAHSKEMEFLTAWKVQVFSPRDTGAIMDKALML